MNVKKIIVGIKPLRETLREFAETYGKAKRGEKIAPSRGISFSSIDDFRRFFSNRRMELLSIIKHRKPKSTYQLAKFADREYKNVYDDVQLLEELGLITKENNHVEVDFNRLLIEVKV